MYRINMIKDNLSSHDIDNQVVLRQYTIAILGREGLWRIELFSVMCEHSASLYTVV